MLAIMRNIAICLFLGVEKEIDSKWLSKVLMVVLILILFSFFPSLLVYEFSFFFVFRNDLIMPKYKAPKYKLLKKRCAISDTQPKAPEGNCIVNPELVLSAQELVATYSSQLTHKLHQKLTTRTQIKLGFNYIIENFIPFSVFVAIFRTIQDTKDDGVSCTVLKDKHTCTIGHRIIYTSRANFCKHFTSLSGNTVTGTRRHTPNKVLVVISPEDPLTIEFCSKKEKVKMHGKYAILNQFGEEVCF